MRYLIIQAYIADSMLWRIELIKYTVKLGYNELGYNEFPVITNKFSPFFSPKIHIFTPLTNSDTTNSRL
jgi:hypothetical protein